MSGQVGVDSSHPLVILYQWIEAEPRNKYGEANYLVVDAVLGDVKAETERMLTEEVSGV